jgi:hypothetical protein
MPSKTDCSVHELSCTYGLCYGHFQDGIGPIRPGLITPAPRQAFRPRTVSHHRLRVRREEATA